MSVSLPVLPIPNPNRQNLPNQSRWVEILGGLAAPLESRKELLKMASLLSGVERMAIVVLTTNPAGLLRAIKTAIDGEEVVTWSYDSDGDFTHTPEQFQRKSWLRPQVQEGKLVFGILAPQNTTMSKSLYGVYHGRFIEMLLTHFDTMFTGVRATAMPTEDDVLS